MPLRIEAFALKSYQMEAEEETAYYYQVCMDCETGSNTTNDAIKEVACSWLLSNSFANHLSINT